MPELALWQWLLGAFCAFSVGLSKTGVPGLGVLVIPLIVITVGDARQSAGWLLPILCFADAVAVFYWRKQAEARQLFSLAPWVIGGVIAGAFALALPERPIRWIVVVIILTMLAIYIRRRLRPDTMAAPHPAAYGITAGFATTVANAAGPVMNLYLLSKQLPKEQFIATGAWFFFLINLSKVPIYLWHGLITRQSLAFDACLIPAVVTGSMTGRWLMNRIPQRTFEILVVVLTLISTMLLLK